jgi:hypothetical protein
MLVVLRLATTAASSRSACSLRGRTKLLSGARHRHADVVAEHAQGDAAHVHAGRARQQMEAQRGLGRQRMLALEAFHAADHLAVGLVDRIAGRGDGDGLWLRLPAACRPAVRPGKQVTPRSGNRSAAASCRAYQ